MADTSPSKAQLRSVLRQRRNALSREQQRIAAEALATRVSALPAWRAARRIAVYLATDGEIATEAVVALAREQNKLVYLPVIGADNYLRFARWDTAAPLIPNRFNIPEPPDSDVRCPVATLDIIFLPLVGWDRRGGRLGMGGGYYDRTLSGMRGPVLVGLAHDCQQVDCVPRDAWDIALDCIATDMGLYDPEIA